MCSSDLTFAVMFSMNVISRPVGLAVDLAGFSVMMISMDMDHTRDGMM